MKLFLVRHGEAEGSSAGRYVGWQDAPLTAIGLRQAEAVAGRLAGEPLAAVYSSDLLRARQTATAVAARHGLSVQLLPGLREADFGAWSGLTYSEIAASDPVRLQSWLADPEQTAPPGGETLADLRRRALAALAHLQLPAAAVAHGGTCRAVLSTWLGCGFWEVPQPLACLSLVEWQPGSPKPVRVPLVGDTSHLVRRLEWGKYPSH